MWIDQGFEMKLIICILVIMSVWQVSYAQSPATEMIPIEWASLETATVGFQTHRGQDIGMDQLLNGKRNTPRPLGQVMNEGLIELKTGDIFYSEEIKFVVSPRGEFTGGSRSGIFDPTGRAPHTPN
jgi:hypothetical protein